MSAEENKAIFRRMIEEVWNQKKLHVADELFTADSTSPSAPQLPPGPEGTKLIASMFLEAFPDLHMEIEHIVAEGDRVGARMRERATHTGPLVTPNGTIPPTGAKVNFTESAIVRFENGKIAESWYELDMLGMLTQLGVIPSPAAAS
jgi:predicted ester cyclase